MTRAPTETVAAALGREGIAVALPGTAGPASLYGVVEAMLLAAPKTPVLAVVAEKPLPEATREVLDVCIRHAARKLAPETRVVALIPGHAPVEGAAADRAIHAAAGFVRDCAGLTGQIVRVTPD